MFENSYLIRNDRLWRTRTFDITITIPCIWYNKINFHYVGYVLSFVYEILDHGQRKKREQWDEMTKRKRRIVSLVSNGIIVVGHRINVLSGNVIQTSIASLILSTIFEMERLRLMNWQVKLYYRANQIFQFVRED